MDDETYNKMERAYNHFNCKNMLEYMLIYLQGDCLQLFDAIRELSETNIKAELINTRNFITFSQLLFSDMLRKTGVKLDLSPPDQKDMFNCLIIVEEEDL